VANVNRLLRETHQIVSAHWSVIKRVAEAFIAGDRFEAAD
jgi:hypothetical protein